MVVGGAVFVPSC